MDIKTVKFQEFEDSHVDVTYEGSTLVYPPLPTPAYMIDGIPYWSRESMLAFGKAVERCQKI